MNQLSRNIVKNVIVAATMGLAGFASWALTDFRAPTIEAAVTQSQQG